MKQLFIFISLLGINYSSITAQNAVNIPLLQAKFITGNNEAYKKPAYNDSGWEIQQLGQTWQAQGHPDYHGYAWYRIHLLIPSSLKETAFWKDSLRIYLAHVNDVDETYLNGKLIGHTGSFPGEDGGYASKWPAVREYHIPLKEEAIHWDSDNIIAIKVFDGGGTGGIFMGQPYIDLLEKINGLLISIDHEQIRYNRDGNASANIMLHNQYKVQLNGTLQTSIVDELTGKTIKNMRQQLLLDPLGKKNIVLAMPNRAGIAIHLLFKEKNSGLELAKMVTLPYILTPQPGDKPVIHGAAVTGLKPGHPFIYKVAATGKKPLSYLADKMPEGLTLNQHTGLITGTIKTAGGYEINITVKNTNGYDTKRLKIKAGNILALTPPMGWNSWNCWGTSVSDDKVRNSAKALVDLGLTGYGWNYINVDDGWQAMQRSADGEMVPDEKFPDMKMLGDYLHGNGLRFGMYSSPGTHTCGGFPGSYQHELQDASMYAGWGVDYLKYDLCSSIDSMKNNVSPADHQHPYKIMQADLAQQSRDIVYSICQYGIKDVWKWGREMEGNLWRTTEDIEDTWESLYHIGFKQDTLFPYAGPGGWNDPDMLTVGMVGWGENLHPTRLTPDEQYTQLSLWSMLSAPLLIGCDLSRLDKFTLNLLTNGEVISIDQDELGKQARRLINKDSIQVYIKDLADGNKAIALFNISQKYRHYYASFKALGLNDNYHVRDLWRQADISDHLQGVEKRIPPHGVFLFKLTSSGKHKK
ncbi:MAG: putative Ig domain-containing protein [Ferruginibacter sp.]